MNENVNRTDVSGRRFCLSNGAGTWWKFQNEQLKRRAMEMSDEEDFEVFLRELHLLLHSKAVLDEIHS